MELKELLLQLNETVPILDEISKIYKNKLQRDLDNERIKAYQENMIIVETGVVFYKGENLMLQLILNTNIHSVGIGSINFVEKKESNIVNLYFAKYQDYKKLYFRTDLKKVYQIDEYIDEPEEISDDISFLDFLVAYNGLSRGISFNKDVHNYYKRLEQLKEVMNPYFITSFLNECQRY